MPYIPEAVSESSACAYVTTTRLTHVSSAHEALHFVNSGGTLICKLQSKIKAAAFVYKCKREFHTRVAIVHKTYLVTRRGVTRETYGHSVCKIHEGGLNRRQ